MEKRVVISSPRYQQIAADVAAKIANNHYKVGDKIYARSSLASQYGVSAETARRAICILSDMNIVESTKGSGVIIQSRENAIKFIKQFQDIQTVNELKRDIIESLQRQSQENEAIENRIINLIDKIDRFKTINPFIPYEITIEKNVLHIGKTLSEINFWHNTAATVIGIKHNDTLLMSPGPYSVLNVGDILYFVGDDNSYSRVHKFLYDE